MSRVENRTFSLPTEHATFIDDLVTSGAYSSGSAVVTAGLSALRARDASMERWLKEDVAPAYDRMKADPARSLQSEAAFAAVRARHAERLKTRG